jgi:hypothetical protein
MPINETVSLSDEDDNVILSSISIDDGEVVLETEDGTELKIAVAEWPALAEKVQELIDANEVA